MKKKLIFIIFSLFLIFDLFLLIITSYPQSLVFLGSYYLRTKLGLIWVIISIFLLFSFIFILKFVELINTKKNWITSYKSVIMLSDLLIILWVLNAAQIARRDTNYLQIDLFGHFFEITILTFSIFISITWMMTLLIFNSTDPNYFGIGIREYANIFYGTTIFFGMLGIGLLMFNVEITNSYFLLSYPVGIIGLITGRRCWRRFLVDNRVKNNIYKINTVVVGPSKTMVEIVNNLLSTEDSAYKLSGLISADKNPVIKSYKGKKVLKYKGINELLNIFRKQHGSQLLFTGNIITNDIINVSWKLKKNEELSLASDISQIVGGRITLIALNNTNILNISSPKLTIYSKILKRLIDITCGFIGLIFFLISYIIVAPLIKLSSQGPIIYKQKRIGLNGKEYNIFKYRSMYTDSDKKLDELLSKQSNSKKPFFKIENDNRITNIGKFLRKYSIDELPQFINVLKGNMSLVGPRPQIQDEIKLYKENEIRRLYVKPGITGLWQIKGRSDLDVKTSFALDLYYVENYSILLDLQILFNTIKVVIAGSGAK